jgi:hypothetical protein
LQSLGYSDSLVDDIEGGKNFKTDVDRAQILMFDFSEFSQSWRRFIKCYQD